MDTGSNGFQLIDCYALVTYIPDPLGGFLDDLRRRLVPGCNPHAHVTLMPPRPLAGAEAEALAQVRAAAQDLPAFDLHIADVSVFPQTNVIFLEIGQGRQMLLAVHDRLNREALAFPEPYPYHPHVTLAQELSAAEIPDAASAARRAWAQWNGPRRFSVQELVFVQNSNCNRWTDLATIRLPQPALTRV